MPRSLRATAVLAALAMNAVIAPGAAFAAEPARTPAAAASTPATPTVDLKPPAPTLLPRPTMSPSPSAAELQAQVDQQQALLDERQTALVRASAKATQALEALQVATRQVEAASRQAAVEGRQLAAARRATARARAGMAAYAGALYRTGSIGRDLQVVSAVVNARNPRQLFSGLGLARRVGGHQGSATVTLAEAEAAQRTATDRATAAQQALRQAEQTAVGARELADFVVAAVTDQVAGREIALLRTQAAAAAASAQERRRAALLAKAERIARERARAPRPMLTGASLARPSATCQGQSTDGYPNGMIPAEALCPLWGTRDQMLRADAAAAFNDMSKAYAQEFGAPICVGDSYRSYEEQVTVAEEKPELAARPGSSNHGWGVATDLCDGIQQFGSPTHRWMQDNSLLYGFFHPSWAQQGGSKPEPWHWEFAG